MLGGKITAQRREHQRESRSRSCCFGDSDPHLEWGESRNSVCKENRRRKSLNLMQTEQKSVLNPLRAARSLFLYVVAEPCGRGALS